MNTSELLKKLDLYLRIALGALGAAMIVWGQCSCVNDGRDRCDAGDGQHENSGRPVRQNSRSHTAHRSTSAFVVVRPR